MLILILMNIDRWFVDPFSLHQSMSWLLLVCSVYLVVAGVLQLRRGGQTGERVPGDSRHAFERTTLLVTTGIYKYIRHPLYSSLLFLTWGVLCKDPSPAALLVAGIATLFLVVTAFVEESECIASLGTAYRTYMSRTKRFIPFLI
ncbi:MAG: isoprenylcysteine carboxylmethyltransferase family protein [Bacteroidota bacterium]